MSRRPLNDSVLLELVREQMLRQGVTPRALAERMGVSHQNIYRKLKSGCDLLTIEAMMLALDIKVQTKTRS